MAMKPYSSARKEAPGKGILLNANEAPRPLLEEPGSLNRYPDPQPWNWFRGWRNYTVVPRNIPAGHPWQR